MTDALQQPVEYRYPSDERPTVAPVDQLPDGAGEWGNYWDYHPYKHGGRFARWDGSQWEVLEVTPPSAWPEDEHIFEWHGVHASDVWEDPEDPMTDYTDVVKSELSTYHDPPIHPAAEDTIDRLIGYVADYAVYRSGHGRPDTVELDSPEEYWQKVARYGVEPAEIGHCDEDNIPDELLDD